MLFSVSVVQVLVLSVSVRKNRKTGATVFGDDGTTSDQNAILVQQYILPNALILVFVAHVDGIKMRNKRGGCRIVRHKSDKLSELGFDSTWGVQTV